MYMYALYTYHNNICTFVWHYAKYVILMPYTYIHMHVWTYEYIACMYVCM